MSFAVNSMTKIMKIFQQTITSRQKVHFWQKNCPICLKPHPKTTPTNFIQKPEKMQI